MTGFRDATPRMSSAEYRRCLDEAGGQVEQLDLTGPAPMSPQPTTPARKGSGGRPVQRKAGAAPKRTPASGKSPRKSRAKPKIIRVAGLLPSAGPTRGPWIVAVDWLGRPTPLNAERAGSIFETRHEKKEWQAAFVEAISAAGVPPVSQAFVTCQAFYDTLNVPDTDGLVGALKAGLDALVQTGVLTDDSRRFLPLGFTALPPVSDGGPPRVVLTVHPLTA